MTSPEHANNLRGNANFRQWILALGASLGTALLIVSPFFWLGDASGHDISFHTSSWLDVAEQWKEGIVYPRWAEWANYGFGEPRFIFYPPFSWMLGAGLSLVVLGNALPGVFVVLAQTLAGLSMYALGRRFFSPAAAMFGAACYAANPYALLLVYMRSDFAEELACAFLPALLLAGLQICGLIENRWRSLPRVTAIFAMLFAAVWLSNVPAAVMASYSMALLFAWAAIGKKSLRPLLQGASGLALGFGLSSFYLLPAAYEQRWVNIAQVLSSGLQPSQNFLYTQIGDPEHNLFNSIASSVAVLLIVMTGAVALLAYRSTKKEEERLAKEKLWRIMLLLCAGATVLMIRPSAIFWEYLPKLRFVQFPWRWMAILAVPYAYFVATLIARRRAAWIWSALMVVTIGGTGIYLAPKAWWDSDDVASLQDSIANGQGFEGTDEYDPVGDDRTNLPQKAPQVQILPDNETKKSAPEAKIDIQKWHAEERIVAVTSREPVRVALRLLNYPAWRIEIFHEGKVGPAKTEESSQMIVSVPAGLSVIRVRFGRTRDRTLGGAVSAGTGIAVLALLCFRQPRRLSRNL